MPSTPSRRLAQRIGGLTTTCLLLGGLAGAGVTWVRETRPRHEPQLPAPSTELTAREMAQAREVADYRDAIPVLTYHEISATQAGRYAVPVTVFAKHLAALRRAGFHSVSLDQVAAFRAGKQVRLPPKPILLTFDDGVSTDWSRADPVLATYGFRAVAFLITGSVAAPGKDSYYLDLPQVRALARTGRWEFGGHTDRLHRFLPAVGGGQRPALDHLLTRPDGTAESHADWVRRVDDDLRSSQDWFRGHLGGPARAFAYPFSAYGLGSNDPAVLPDLRELLTRHGYHLGFTGEQQEPGAAVLAGGPPMALPRLGVRGDTTVSNLLLRIRQSLPTPMPRYLSGLVFQGTSARCEKVRGPAGVPGIKVVALGPYGRCREVGSTVTWRNYRLSVDVRGVSRTTSATVALRDPDPGGVPHGRFEVLLGESAAELRQYVDGAVEPRHRVGYARRSRPGGPTDRHLDVTVLGNVAVVSIDRRPPVRVPLDPGIASGGVALSVGTRTGHPVVFANALLHPLPSPLR